MKTERRPHDYVRVKESLVKTAPQKTLPRETLPPKAASDIASNAQAQVRKKRFNLGFLPGAFGGAWKVAYADFTTAMMAFFMLLWLLNVAPPETLAGLADYFSPTTAAITGNTGSDAINPPSETTVGSAQTRIRLITQPGPPITGPQNSQKTGGDGKEQESNKLSTKRDIMAERQQSLEDESFQDVEDQIKIALQKSPLLNQHTDQILFEITEDGLKIQLIDKDRRAMFKPGSDVLYSYAIALITEVGRAIDGLDNRVALEGHTDGGIYIGPGGIGNWELSANRANSARRVLEATGINDERLFEVTGKASTNPLYPDQPNRIENRRITIQLLRESPVVPPSVSEIGL